MVRTEVPKSNLGAWEIQPEALVNPTSAFENATSNFGGSNRAHRKTQAGHAANPRTEQVREIGGVTMESNRPTMKSRRGLNEISSPLL